MATLAPGLRPVTETQTQTGTRTQTGPQTLCANVTETAAAKKLHNGASWNMSHDDGDGTQEASSAAG